jgi:hypothetical protein
MRLTDSRIERNARAGVSSFGANASLGSCALDCNALHLDEELLDGASASFVDLTGNVCGCEGAVVACQAQSSNLAPPNGLLSE